MDFIKLKHLLSGYVFRAKSSGLIRHEKDERDFDTSILGWGEYKPLNTRKVIQTKSIKNQSSKNNCQWQATTAQKEVDEDVILSARSLSSYGQKNGMVTGNGFSSLISGQKSLQNWGIAEEQTVGGEDINDWESYVSINLANLTQLAEQHKIKSYWSISSRNDRLKALDENRPIVTGIDWYTGYNQGGGFSSPWIINNATGWKIGGHAILMIGYDLNYFGKKVYIFQNSYGADWGDNGKFYIEMDFFDSSNYGCYINLDIPLDEAKKLNIKDMLKSIMRDSKGGLWFVKNGKKQKISGLMGMLTAYTVEFGVETNDSKLNSLKETTEFFPVGK